MTTPVDVTDRILAFGVHVSISDDSLRAELLTNYEGIKHVQRCLKDDLTPKDTIKISFKSAKHAQHVLEDGFIYVCSLRCPVKGLKPSPHVLNEIHTNNGSDNQSKISTQDGHSTDRILLHDVPVTITDADLKRELLNMYGNVQRVKRWFNHDKPDNPTERVQIYFRSSENIKDILEKGFIKIGRYSFPVTSLKPSMRLQNELDTDNKSDYQPESQVFSEQDLIEALEKQKR